MNRAEARRFAAYAAAQMIESAMGSGALCAWDQVEPTDKDADRVRSALHELVARLRARGESTSIATVTL